MTENRNYLFNKFKEIEENGVMEIDLIKLKISNLSSRKDGIWRIEV